MTPRSRRRRTIALVVAGLAALWLVVAAWLVLSARADVEAGADDLRAVRREASIASLVEPERADELAGAADRFARASDRLGSPVLAPVRILPVVGRHLDAARDLAQVGEDGAEAARVALTDLQALTERSRAAGPERVQTLRELATVADDAGAALGALDVPSGDALVSPLSRAIVELGEQRAEAVDATEQMSATATALADLLEGPEPYLLLGANNAEMRVGSGMFLSAAELGLADGELALGDVVSATESAGT